MFVFETLFMSWSVSFHSCNFVFFVQPQPSSAKISAYTQQTPTYVGLNNSYYCKLLPQLFYYSSHFTSTRNWANC